jgi:hypothetical protein
MKSGAGGNRKQLFTVTRQQKAVFYVPFASVNGQKTKIKVKKQKKYFDFNSLKMPVLRDKY